MTQQTAESVVPPTPPPFRRRRLAKRLVIVICLLGFLYGAAKWISRPSDRRLVGEWEFTEKGPLAEHKGYHLLPPSRFTFESDGDALLALGRFPPPKHRTWNVENNRLVLTDPDRPLWHKIYMAYAKRFVFRQDIPRPSGPTSSHLQSVYEIIPVSQDYIVLDHIAPNGDKSGLEWHLRRIGDDNSPSPSTEPSATTASGN